MAAPQLTPKKPSDRVKTDKHDAMKLAKRLKAKKLHPIYEINGGDPDKKLNENICLISMRFLILLRILHFIETRH